MFNEGWFQRLGRCLRRSAGKTHLRVVDYLQETGRTRSETALTTLPKCGAPMELTNQQTKSVFQSSTRNSLLVACAG